MRYIFLLCFAMTHGLLAQCPDIATLIEIGEERVSQEDFVRLYTKNNIDGSADFSEESLNEYLELYINYRLKVQEAYALEMDTISRILREFNGYRL
ncbi:MAG: peptidylprolyl isomerase, partial [Bacteroidota bacterium]|nr:peptidylprolyl isomerase [Bacteroidota bacterium]